MYVYIYIYIYVPSEIDVGGPPQPAPHGRQSPVPDPRVFAWGRGVFLSVFIVLLFLFPL